MRPWQRNRFALVAAIFAAIVTMNIPSLDVAQIASLLALYALLFFLYVKFFNRYDKK